MTPNRLEYDVAYGGFLFCGLVVVSGVGLALAPLPPGWAPGLALVVGVPLFLAWCLAALGAMALSLHLRRERALLVSTVATVVLMAVFVVGGSWPVIRQVVALVYGVTTIVSSGRWFFMLRSRRVAARDE